MKRISQARIPTPHGDFTLVLYRDEAGAEHGALVLGEVAGHASVLVRVHSECFTGDTLGSLRCDCGSQLLSAIKRVSHEGTGVIVYLRQEGRGIGLAEKLRAYNLQDQGLDTVDANIALGHEPDERDYTVAARILEDLRVESVTLITNNPAKVDGLAHHGIPVLAREPSPGEVTRLNRDYLATKSLRLGHLGGEQPMSLLSGLAAARITGLTADAPDFAVKHDRPFVTLTYAQSLDGSIALNTGASLSLSGTESMAMTHRLRAAHDAILVGIDTVIADDPQLNVRYAPGRDPQPIVLDSTLRFPVGARLLRNPRPPWIATTSQASPARKAAVEAAGARVIEAPADVHSWVDLRALLSMLVAEGISSVMVEGGAKVIGSFLSQRLVDEVIITIAPCLVGGLQAIASRQGSFVRPGDLPRLQNVHHEKLGEDVVIWGEAAWPGER